MDQDRQTKINGYTARLKYLREVLEGERVILSCETQKGRHALTEAIDAEIEYMRGQLMTYGIMNL